MKKAVVLVSLLLLSISVYTQITDNVYDSVLAKSLGADDYGMKYYYLVILKTGRAEIEEKTMLDSLFAGHMQNISRLADEGKLVVAGPIARNDNAYRGIFILNAASMEEAHSMVLTDPVISNNVMEADIYRWYGSAALPEYLKVHQLIQKVKP
jgi:uncharacterized protein YciI